MASVINQIKAPDNVTYNLAHSVWATCATAASTATKTAYIDGTSSTTGFTLINGVMVNVTFTYANTASSPKLSVNGTTAQPIYYKSNAIDAKMLLAGIVYTFVYDNTSTPNRWNLVNPPVAQINRYGSSGVDTSYVDVLKIHHLSWDQYRSEDADGSIEDNELYIRPNEALTIQYNSGTTEGTNKFTYDGSAAKTINVSPYNHVHGNITNDGKLGTASMVVVTDGSKNITTSSTISTTELGYLDGVTSNIQTQLNDRLKLDGSTTMTGKLVVRSGSYCESTSYTAADFTKGGLDMNNSDITNANSIYFKDSCDNAYEGIHFFKESGKVHTLWCSQAGTLTYTPDRAHQATGTAKFSVTNTGAVSATSYTATSDKRLKENFQPFTSTGILDLPVYKFDFIDGPKNQVGCIAQDLQKICPELVQENESGHLTIQESKIVYLLLEEVKKLKQEIKELKQK